MAPSMAAPANRHDHGRVSFLTGLRNARQNNSASTAYSVRWAHFRTPRTTSSTAFAEACGNNHSTIGLMIRDERPADFVSLDARNIRANHRRITTQYLRNTRSLDTAPSKQGSHGQRNFELISFAHR